VTPQTILVRAAESQDRDKRLARVRSVVVSGKRYLQVIESQSGSISVLGSFGEYRLENWLRANQFANSYNQLRDLAQAQPQTGDSEEFFRAALAIFGVILGAAIVAAILGKN